MDDDDDLPDELLEGEGAGRPVQRRRAKKAAARAAAATAASAAAAERAGAARAARRRMLTRVGIGIAALAAVAVIAVGGYNLGAPRVPGVSGTAAPEPSAAASGGVDTAQVSALMQRISANPKDTDALLKLGNMYFDAGDYKSAGDFMQKLVDADPTNVDALVGLGAALFNQNQADAARTAWTKAIALNPKSQEAHFDLGFLYLNQDPPDMTQVKAEWNTVIAIDPNSDLAKSVKTHLDAFASASPGTSAAAAAPTAGASSAPVTSPAPSATSGN